MIYHFTFYVRSDVVALDLVYRWFRAGDRGVDLFFVLSGFLITGILLKAKERAPAIKPYLTNFYWRRTLRIFPLYYLTLAVFLLGVIWFVTPKESLKDNQWMLWAYVSNMGLAFIDSRLFDDGPIRLLHFWSLAIEEQFYVVWPLVVWFLPRRVLIGLCLMGGVFSAVVWYFLVAKGLSAAPWYFTLCRVDGLCVGAAMAALMPAASEKAWLRKTLGAVAIGGLAVLAFSVVVDVNNVFSGPAVGMFAIRQAVSHAGELGMAAAVGIVALGGAAWADRLLSSAPLTFFGKYSYGLYVWHYAVVMQLSFAYFTPGKLSGMLTVPGALIASCAIGIGLSVVLALLSYHLFEDWFLRLKDARPKNATVGEAQPPVVAGEAAFSPIPAIEATPERRPTGGAA